MSEELAEYIDECFKCMQKLSSIYENYAKTLGLSYTSFKILWFIYKTENCTQKDISDILFLPKQTINAVINTFYDKGYIKLAEMPENRKVKIIHFTDSGKEYAENIVSKIRDYEYKFIQTLESENIEIFFKTIKSYTEYCHNVLTELHKNID